MGFSTRQQPTGWVVDHYPEDVLQSCVLHILHSPVAIMNTFPGVSGMDFFFFFLERYQNKKRHIVLVLFSVLQETSSTKVHVSFIVSLR